MRFKDGITEKNIIVKCGADTFLPFSLVTLSPPENARYSRSFPLLRISENLLIKVASFTPEVFATRPLRIWL